MCLVLCFTTTLLAPFLGVYARPGSIVSIPSYVQYEQLIKDIHGQDEKLLEVMLHFFIRHSYQTTAVAIVKPELTDPKLAHSNHTSNAPCPSAGHTSWAQILPTLLL
jgi:hypothetical protein